MKRDFIILIIITSLLFIKLNPYIYAGKVLNNSVPKSVAVGTLGVGETITGFTLAEVLITLTVIGVIAALTIPTLIQDIQDAQLKTAWKRGFSDLEQASNKLILDSGGTLNGVFQNTSDMINKFSPYFSSTKVCPSGSGCWHAGQQWQNLDGSKRADGGYPGIILSNGNLIMFVFESQDCSNTSHSSKVKDCGFIYEDINGFKGPNTIGKDIYLIWLTEKGPVPCGANDGWAVNCGDGTSGWGCAAQYLRQ